MSCEENFLENQIINPSLTKLVRSRWLDMASFFFCEFMEIDSVSVHKHPKKRTRRISSHLDRTSLVNNQYRKTQIQMIFITLLVVLEVQLLQLIHAFQQVPENYNYCSHRVVCLEQRKFKETFISVRVIITKLQIQ